MHNFSAFKGISSLVFVIAFGFYEQLKSQAPELLYYKFDGTGTSIPNLATAPPSGTENATIIGSHSQGGAGQGGGALISQGGSSADNYLNTNWNTNLTGTSWTISFWSNNIEQSSETGYVFGDVNASSFRCFTGGTAGSGNWILRGNMADVLAIGGASNEPSITAFVYKADSSIVKAYVNGLLVNTVTTNPIINGVGPFKIGGYAQTSALRNGGLIDEFRVYNRALSASEILSLNILSPEINIEGTANNFEACTGHPSVSQTFMISGSGLTENMSLTAPENFEVSFDAENDYGSSVNISPIDGSVSQTNVYVRLASNVNGSYSGNLILSSTGATSQEIVLTGSTAACPPPVASCYANTVIITVNPSHLVYNGPGAADVYKVNASLFDNGSTSTTTATREVARLSFPVSSSSSSSSVFNWTTNGACTDATPGGGITDEDKGYSWESCLPVTPADYGKIRNYKLRITNLGGSSICTNGKYKIVYSSNPSSPVFTILDEEIMMNAEGNDIMNVYPNPGLDKMYIDLSIDFKDLESYSLSIYDALGREIKSLKKLETTFLTIDTENLSRGTYTLSLKSKERLKTVRWIKI